MFFPANLPHLLLLGSGFLTENAFLLPYISHQDQPISGIDVETKSSINGLLPKALFALSIAFFAPYYIACSGEFFALLRVPSCTSWWNAKPILIMIPISVK